MGTHDELAPRPVNAPDPSSVLAEWETNEYIVYELRESHRFLAFRLPEPPESPEPSEPPEMA